MYTFHAFLLWHYDDGWDATESIWRSSVRDRLNEPEAFTPEERTAVLEAEFKIDELTTAMPNDEDKVILLERDGEPVLHLERRNFHCQW